MSHIYIVIEGGCVRYVSSDLADAVLNVAVVDIDDMNYAGGDDRREIEAKLADAEALPRIW